MTVELDIVVDAGATLGEGPVWNAAEGRLLWVDILEGQVHSLHPGTGEDQILETPCPVGAVAPRACGGLVLALEHGFAVTDGDAIREVAAVRQPGPAWRFNDGKCDPQGRFWAGTMAYDFSPGAGALYRLAPGGAVSREFAPVTISNGLAWSLDERTLYYVDTPTGGVDAFDFDGDSGRISRRRRVIDLEQGIGDPDGITLDAQGCLWVALFDGGAVRRYRPDGSHDMTIRLPVAKATSVAFGGRDLDILFITTARLGLDDRGLADQPHAGAVFACRPGVSGVPVHAFAG